MQCAFVMAAATTTDPCKYTKYLTTRSTGAGYFDRPRVSCYFNYYYLDINTRFSRLGVGKKNARDVLVDTGVDALGAPVDRRAPLVRLGRRICRFY